MISEVLSASVWPLLIVQATLCMAVGLAAGGLLRSSAARTHQILLTSLVAALLMPGTYAGVKHLRIGVLASEPPPALRPPAESSISFGGRIVDILPTTAEYEPVPPDDGEPLTVAPAQAETAAAPLPWGTICLGGWIVISATLVGRLVLRFALGLRLVETALPVENDRLCRAAESARGRMGIVSHVRIRCSERINSPIIWCWTRQPALLVPVGAEDRPNDADWVSVFCHELAHLRRRDHVSGLFAEVLTALLPWHPLLWWAAARLSKLSEQACDDWVLAGGHSGVDYAETLLGLAAQRQMAFVPTVIGKEKTMNVRIRRIIKDRCGDPRIGARWTAGVSLLALLAIVSVGFAQRRPVEQPEREREAAPERRETQERRDAAPQWQQEILRSKLGELAEQINARQARLREGREMPPEERRIQEFELDLLRDVAAQIERRLEGLDRPAPRPTAEADRRREVDERVAGLKRELEEIARARSRTERAIEGLRDDQDAEARELQGQLRELRAQSRQREEALASLERARVPAERPAPVQRQVAARGATVQRVPTPPRIPQQAEPRNVEERRQPRSVEQRPVPGEGDERRPRASGDIYGNRASRTPQPTAPTQRPARSIQSEIKLTRVFKLQHAGAAQVRALVQALLGETGQVEADERTGSVIVTAGRENQENVERVIRALDVPGDGGDLRDEVKDLRNQMNGLREQLLQMQVLLRQAAERGRSGDPR